MTILMMISLSFQMKNRRQRISTKSVRNIFESIMKYVSIIPKWESHFGIFEKSLQYFINIV